MENFHDYRFSVIEASFRNSILVQGSRDFSSKSPMGEEPRCGPGLYFSIYSLLQYPQWVSWLVRTCLGKTKLEILVSYTGENKKR